MLEQQLDHSFFGLVVGGVEPLILEELVLAHQLGRGIWDGLDEVGEGFTVEGGLEVLNDVELDATVLQDLEGTA